MTGKLPGEKSKLGEFDAPDVSTDDEPIDPNDKPFAGDDQFRPYNEQLKLQGITFNEWRDKEYDWDLRV